MRTVNSRSTFVTLAVSASVAFHPAPSRGEDKPFDGRPWNVSTGNVSVNFIQASPIGAHPREGMIEAPPSLESQAAWRRDGLVANEDYVAGGAVERTRGKWEWAQHDAMERRMHGGGLKYVIYDGVHFPPVWLR